MLLVRNTRTAQMGVVITIHPHPVAQVARTGLCDIEVLTVGRDHLGEYLRTERWSSTQTELVDDRELQISYSCN